MATLVAIGLAVFWPGAGAFPGGPLQPISRNRGAGEVRLSEAWAQEVPSSVGPIYVSDPVTPVLTVAARDLPPHDPANGFPILDREMAQRDNHGFIGPDVQMPPHGNPLAQLQREVAISPDGLGLPFNFAGAVGYNHPPDDTGDVGPNHYVQGVNTSATSAIYVFNKSGNLLTSFYMDDLAPTSPCNTGYCDPIVQYDQMADRWMISEFDTSLDNLCVYISQTPDPTGAWYAYAFNPAGTDQDYPHYAVWWDGYYVSANNGGYVHVLDRQRMLNGLSATAQSFTIGTLPGWGFQLTMPATIDGASPAPPTNAPAIFMRQRDTEIHGGTCTNCDLMEMWNLRVNWTTPANSTLTQLASIQMSDWDQTVCGTTQFGCMDQPGTTQLIDPIREPLHYPLQYRNFTTHETVVGCFVEDEDGTDHVTVHWFEIRRTPSGAGSWVLQQEGVLGGDPRDRGVCSAAMDGGGNIVVGYTRTGGTAPYYPSIYYSGRLSTDPLGTMPYFDQVIWDATNSHTGSDRWGDYAGIGVDPADDCTFWFTTEYGGSGNTRIAGIRFDPVGAAPDSVSACIPNNVTFNVNVIKSCFKNPVTLSTSGRPGGTTESWSLNPVTPPGTAVLTIGNTGALTPGVYTFNVIGTSGSLSYNDTVSMQLSSAAPGAATLTAPADGSTGVATGPTFTWNDVADEAGYILEIATDPAFSSIVHSASLAANTVSYNGATLSSDTVYYWRVRASNACGSTNTPTWAFRTAALACTTYVSTDIPKEIKSNPAPGDVISTLNVPTAGSIVDVDVLGLQGTHTYISDLYFRVRSPAGTEVVIMNRSCTSEDNFDLNLDDEATPGSWPCPPVGGGTYQPSNPLSGFDGQAANGTWSMIVNDSYRADGGFLNAWGLRICTGSGVTAADYSDLASSNGIAWHTGDGSLRLGALWDSDIVFGVGTDDASDDGIILDPTTPWSVGATVSVHATISGADGNDYLAGWFDWNDDGDFSDAGDKVIGQLVVNGMNDLSFLVPAGYMVGNQVNGRFRLYESEPAVLGSEMPYGATAGGEDEDSRFTPPGPTAVELVSFTAAPSRDGVLVRWETATERNNVGFNLYRSASTDELGEQLNAELIPSLAPGGDQGASYEYLDTTALPGLVYYYTLEDIDINGGRTQHGPAMLGLWRAYLPLVWR